MKYSSAPYLSAIRLAIFCAVTSFGTAAPVQWTTGSGGNGHWYELVTQGDIGGGLTWSDARSDALSRTWLGGSGYLATITSADENEFITELLVATGDEVITPYIGGLLLGGLYQWADGPESGDPFTYTNWSAGQPSGDGPATQVYWFGAVRPDLRGKWNDISGLQPIGYIVEYTGEIPEPATLFPVVLSLLALQHAYRRRLNIQQRADGSGTVGRSAGNY